MLISRQRTVTGDALQIDSRRRAKVRPYHLFYFFQGKMLRAADLFCGGGGTSEGIRQSGVAEVVVAVDNDPRALAIHHANHGPVAVQADLAGETERLAELIRGVDIVFASCPCQDFSQNGLHVEGERADLTRKTAALITAARPAVFVMENVPQVLGSEAYQTALDIFLPAGYHVGAVLVCVSQLGLAQSRRRALVFGTLGAAEALEAVLDEATALSLQPRATLGGKAPLHVQTRYCVWTWLGSRDRIPTLRCGCGSHVLRAPGHKLPLSELGELAGFPANYSWPGAPTAASRAIGNAAPPPLMAWAARQAGTLFNTPRPDGEEARLLTPRQNCLSDDAPRGMRLLGITRFEDAEAAARLLGAKIRCATPLVIRYEMGSGALDERAQEIARCRMPHGWILEVRQRGHSVAAADDLYWYVPDGRGQCGYYRSKISLINAGLLSGADVW